MAELNQEPELTLRHVTQLWPALQSAPSAHCWYSRPTLPPSVCYWNSSGADTHQAIQHLIEDGTQTPPVHCPVIRLLV